MRHDGDLHSMITHPREVKNTYFARQTRQTREFLQTRHFQNLIQPHKDRKLWFKTRIISIFKYWFGIWIIFICEKCLLLTLKFVETEAIFGVHTFFYPASHQPILLPPLSWWVPSSCTSKRDGQVVHRSSVCWPPMTTVDARSCHFELTLIRARFRTAWGLSRPRALGERREYLIPCGVRQLMEILTCLGTRA